MLARILICRYMYMYTYILVIYSTVLPWLCCVLPSRRFEQLSELMSECDNGQRYQEEIEKLMTAKESFIPFLGSFLTQVCIHA